VSTFRYGPSKGQVRHAVQVDGLPKLLREVLPSLSLFVFEGGEAVVSSRLLVDHLLDDEVKALARLPGVFRDGDKWYFAAFAPAGQRRLRGFSSVQEWEDYAPGPEAAFYPEPAGATTHWPAGHVEAWRF
jgi:hypothetical protein